MIYGEPDGEEMDAKEKTVIFLKWLLTPASFLTIVIWIKV